MRILLDTNIVIHREAATVIDEDIGVLFRWLDNLHYTKCILPVTVEEIAKHEDPKVRKSLAVKLGNYNVLRTRAPMSETVRRMSETLDKNRNDLNDTLIINELFCGRVDALITEDKQLLNKASLLSILDQVYTIDAFLEKVNAENPEMADYRVLSVRKSLFGDLRLSDDFFTSFKEDYPDYEKWFNKKAEEPAYICVSEDKPIALLYLKVEGHNEDYRDINPPFTPKRRLKIGSFKVTLNGFRLGERFLKIVFDNALLFKVDEVYVTIFDKRIEQQRLINLLGEYGFCYHGFKTGPGGQELVYTRSCERSASRSNPKQTYPFFSMSGRFFIVPINADYHTELFPDSILHTESPMHFVENQPHRNAISKVYISRSIERNLDSGDVILFYRFGDQPAYYRSVITTIGVAENVVDNIQTEEEFIRLCMKRSVFSDAELSQRWHSNRRDRPFIVDFLYVYSLPRRITRQKLIEMGVVSDPYRGPRGFTQISRESLKNILREGQADEHIAVD